MFSSGLSVKIDRLLFAHLAGKASSPKPSDNQPQIILHFATSHNNQSKTKRKPNQNQTKPNETKRNQSKSKRNQVCLARGRPRTLNGRAPARTPYDSREKDKG